MKKSFPVLVAAAALASCSSEPQDPSSMLITNAVIVDGSGIESGRGDVRIDGDVIVAVGELQAIPGEAVLDANGLVLAPGFIDAHSHHDLDIETYRSMPAALSQGITTVVRATDGQSIGEDIYTYIPLTEFNSRFAEAPPAINMASLAPHGSIRYAVMGKDYRRHATREEIARMEALLEADMHAGAIGLSTGLEYEPGMYSSTEELIQLARASAKYGGVYVTHLRDEDDRIVEALDEALMIGDSANIHVHISHIKIADRAMFGRSAELIRRMEASISKGNSVSADVYPYLRWQADLGVLFPQRDFDNREAGEYTFEHSAAAVDIVLASYPPQPEYEGLSIAEIAAETGQSAVDTLLALSKAADDYREETGQPGSSIIAKGMSEEDMVAFMLWRNTSICTDGSHASGHPRGHGAFTRVLGRYVRELGTMTIEEAIHKMTGLSAKSLRIARRGRIAPGFYADLVLLDPDEVIDRATMQEPMLQSTGIEKVWVNGVMAFADGEPTDAYAGRPATTEWRN